MRTPVTPRSPAGLCADEVVCECRGCCVGACASVRELVRAYKRLSFCLQGGWRAGAGQAAFLLRSYPGSRLHRPGPTQSRRPCPPAAVHPHLLASAAPVCEGEAAEEGAGPRGADGGHCGRRR